MAISPNRSGERCNVFGQQKVEEKSGKIVPIVGVEKAYKSVPIVGVKKRTNQSQSFGRVKDVMFQTAK